MNNKYEDIIKGIDVTEVKQYYLEENHTYTETLEHFRFSKEWFLDRFLKENHLSKRDSYITNKRNEISREDLKQYYLIENHSLKDTMEHFNCATSCLKRLLKEWELQKPQREVIKLGCKTREVKYGDPWYVNREKRIETNLKRYGSANPHNYAKIQETLIKKYGSVENSYIERQKKTVQTNILKYGTSSVLSNPKIKEKTKATIKRLYGVDYFVQSEEFKEKSRQTCLQKYGVTNYSQTLKSRKDNSERIHKAIAQTGKPWDFSKHSRKYTYKGITFDSSWEIALFIYLTDNSIDFQYHPPIKFEYVVDETSHWYEPDFIIKGELVEIKSSFLLNSMRDTLSPYYNPKENEKYNCILEHGVKLLSDKEINKYIEYVADHYGKNYIKQFRNKGA